MENVDEKSLFIIETAALTHDIGIHICEEKYGECGGRLQEKEGPAIAAELLDRLGFDSKVSERVQYLIGHHHTYNNIDGIDSQILVEADLISSLSSLLILGISNIFNFSSISRLGYILKYTSSL